MGRFFSKIVQSLKVIFGLNRVRVSNPSYTQTHDNSNPTLPYPGVVSFFRIVYQSTPPISFEGSKAVVMLMA